MAIELIITSDGSHTLRNTELEETYHSIHGAIQESQHVFIEAGLKEVLKRKINELRILEVGFGTGLNALLTLLQTDKQITRYTAIESTPLSIDLIEKLNYSQLSSSDKDQFLKIHQSDWGQEVDITEHFTLRKIHNTIQQTDLPTDHFDLVYFDAFAPDKQPGMWEIEVLEHVVRSMNKQGVLVTYCAKGQFKRDLKKLGLSIESLPGPPGKFEMVRAKMLGQQG